MADSQQESGQGLRASIALNLKEFFPGDAVMFRRMRWFVKRMGIIERRRLLR
jgi:hypothetical protein